MAKKVSSKRLASIAGRVLEHAKVCKKIRMQYWGNASEIVALAASVLSQTEPKPKAKSQKKGKRK